MDCLPVLKPRLSSIEFAETFPKMMSLVHHPVRCGKKSCRCARGELHTSWRLVWRENRRQRRRYVRADELDAVRVVVERRQAEARAARLERELALATLREWKRWMTEIERDLCR
jgi:hypothetical protein